MIAKRGGDGEEEEVLEGWHVQRGTGTHFHVTMWDGTENAFCKRLYIIYPKTT